MSGVTVHGLVDAVASRDAERIAVSDTAGDCTYGELRERSDAVACMLVDAGVKRGDWVGVHLSRSSDLVVGVLGVLKTGAAFVPLDPGFPPARLALMVDDAGLKRVLSERSLDDTPLAVDERLLMEDVARSVDSTALPEVRADDLAYVIYTSGSTGRPKGVKVPHRAVVNLLRSMAREPGIDSGDRWLAVTTLSFDISVLELLGPLSVGACTCVASSEEVLDGSGLLSALERTGANVMQATPVSWRMLLEVGWPGSPGFTALCGGEVLPRDLADAILARVGTLWNMYGPTETTIWSTCHRVVPDEPVFIGKPIDETLVYVLDEAGRRVPPGVVGELFIGGAGVTDGYHERPDESEARFVTDPFRSAPSARMYRTGDVVRQRRDGVLEYRGRIDDQVKVRGFRVELGEIEVALRRLDGVRQAVVAVSRRGASDDRLVAFLVVDGPPPEAGRVRSLLAEALPDYMIPHHFVAVDDVPTTPNGKVDRKALLDRYPVVLESGEGHEPPSGPVEEAVAEVMAEVLGRERMSAEANFFEVGGHSVLAMRVVAVLRAGPAPDVTLRDLFRNPTVRSLAGVISAHGEPSATEEEEFVF